MKLRGVIEPVSSAEMADHDYLFKVGRTCIMRFSLTMLAHPKIFMHARFFSAGRSFY
jgi:hypothetical protein